MKLGVNTTVSTALGSTTRSTATGAHGKSLLYQNHGSRLDEELRHRKADDPYYASVSGKIIIMEVGLSSLTSRKK